MQNTRSAHIASFPPPLILIAAALLPFLLLTISPACAGAGEYAMPHVDIAAEVTDAGDVHVVEKRQFDFPGGSTAVRWTFAGLPPNASVEIGGVSLRQGSGEALSGEPSREIPAASFQAAWRTSGGPGGEAYSWDGAGKALYVFPDVADTSLLVTLDYTVRNGINAYRDVGELYWQYVTADWEAASGDVTATVSLPVPAGQRVRPGDNVRAWGHGPLDGRLGFDDEGDIVYTAPEVLPGQYAEARVVFPASWLPGLSESSRDLHENEDHLQAVLEDEKTWADTANAQHIQGLAFTASWLVFSAALLVWALAAFFRRGRDHEPRPVGRYRHDAPDGRLSPAAVGRLMSWEKRDSGQFTATFMRLTAKGVVRIEGASPAAGGGRRASGECRLVLPADTLDEMPVDPLERMAIDIVFGDIAAGAGALQLRDVKAYAREHPGCFSGKMGRWHDELTAEVAEADLFEAGGSSLQKSMRAVAGGYLAAGCLAALFFSNAWPLVPVVPTCLLLVVIAHFMQRRTQRGADVAAACGALRRWLLDFADLGEGIPEDPSEWGGLLVYAHLFGIADEVMRSLRSTVPAFRGMDDDALAAAVPVCRWCLEDDAGQTPAHVLDGILAGVSAAPREGRPASSGNPGAAGGGLGGDVR